MADYKALYEAKLTSCEEIAKQVQSGWNLIVDAGPAHANAILNAIAEKILQTDTKDVSVQMLLDTYPYPFLESDAWKGKLTGYSWFSSGGLRKAVGGGYADVMPSYYRDIPGHIRREYEYDACLIAVSPMDKHGYFSMATTCSYSPAMIEKSKRIFVEVNNFQPRCVNGTQIHISQVAALVENHHPLPVLPPTQLDEKSILIGNLIAEQIPDGACIQLGIGAIPDATGIALKNKKD
ncbi:MAG: 4-hydroxybutyrate--acetyl-CoA CoA transferase, partial [Oscillospiraceae bacterium]|nr:4-hydroxybutyrate--acetyl-CoA CoA transferase [Oscillospiraceae bacterium]